MEKYNEKTKEIYDMIKQKIGEKLTKEQIEQIISGIDLENEEVPRISVTSNPYDFEKYTRRTEDIFEHSWAGSTRNYVDTQVLMGDYEPGIDKRYEYSENGDNRTPDEEHEMSDFSMNKIQVAKVNRDYMDNFNGSDIEEYDEYIQIYIPEEKKLPKEISFKQYVLNKRREKMENKLKEILGDKINLNQIDKIIETIDFEKEKVPEIVTISDPYEFEKKTRRSEDIFEHSWAGATRDYVDTQVLIGDYEPGIDKRYEYSENGDNRSPEEEHEMSDFSMNQIQVAKVNSDYMDNFNGNDIEEHKETIQIYMPNEKEYYENVSFKKMVLEKENNEKNPIVEEIRKLASKKVEIKDKEQKAKKLANEYEKQYKTLNNEEKEYNE